jgi:dihydroorotase
MLILKNGLLIDPSTDQEPTIKDLWIDDNKIIKAESSVSASAEIIDLAGKWICPGLIDFGSLVDPAQIATEFLAATTGGFKTVYQLPNVSTPLDSLSQLEYFKLKTALRAPIEVKAIASLSKNGLGKELVEIDTLHKAGAIAFYANGSQSLNLLKIALQYTAILGATIISQANEPSLTDNGQIHHSGLSLRLGLKGIPPESESAAIAAQLEVLRLVPEASLHFTKLSNVRSVELIREAKDKGLKVTCDVTAQHLALTCQATEKYNTNAKVFPPLRAENDRQAILKGIQDGTIDCLISDHMALSSAQKNCTFTEAAFGTIAFETALSVYLQELVHSELINPIKLIEMLTVNPRMCLNQPKFAGLKAGSKADLTIIDPTLAWTFEQPETALGAYNSPFYGRQFKGRAVSKKLLSKRPDCN